MRTIFYLTREATRDLSISHCRQYTTNYVYPGHSVKHPLSREASLRVNIKDLELDPETEGYFRDLVSANQNIRLSDLHPRTYEHFRLPKSELQSSKMLEMLKVDSP